MAVEDYIAAVEEEVHELRTDVEEDYATSDELNQRIVPIEDTLSINRADIAENDLGLKTHTLTLLQLDARVDILEVLIAKLKGSYDFSWQDIRTITDLLNYYTREEIQELLLNRLPNGAGGIVGNIIFEIINGDLITKHIDETTNTLVTTNIGKVEGDSIFDIAVKYGFTGTEQEWLSLNSLTPEQRENLSRESVKPATDQEFAEGTSTTLVPSVKQVKDAIADTILVSEYPLITFLTQEGNFPVIPQNTLTALFTSPDAFKRLCEEIASNPHKQVMTVFADSAIPVTCYATVPDADNPERDTSLYLVCMASIGGVPVKITLNVDYIENTMEGISDFLLGPNIAYGVQLPSNNSVIDITHSSSTYYLELSQNCTINILALSLGNIPVSASFEIIMKVTTPYTIAFTFGDKTGNTVSNVTFTNGVPVDISTPGVYSLMFTYNPFTDSWNIGSFRHG